MSQTSAQSPALIATSLGKKYLMALSGLFLVSFLPVHLIGNLLLIYLFVAGFWSLWEQSNGQTWTLQATSDLMDKHIGFGITMLPAQIQVVNALFILLMVPLFTFGIYPLWARFAAVTPLRKIGAGIFIAASSFLMVGRIEAHIQAGQSVSVWWQILAYVVLTASEVLVSITCLEFSYKQAPLRMKSFIMALYLLAISVGNAKREMKKALINPKPSPMSPDKRKASQIGAPGA